MCGAFFFSKSGGGNDRYGDEGGEGRAVCSLKWIPFAFDGSRAYLFLDMSPAKEGKAGQVIAVDYDRNQCWLLADSLDKLTAQTADGASEEIALPAGFWQERYKAECVPASRFAKEKTLFLKGKTVDCTLFRYTENLKELILHNCLLENAEYMTKAPQLKRLFLVNCTWEGESLAVLAEAQQLKELSVNEMCAEGLPALQKSKTLKNLSLRNAGIKIEELAGFTGLQELCLEDMGCMTVHYSGIEKSKDA